MTGEIISWEMRRIVEEAVKARFPERHHYRDLALAELMISFLDSYPKNTKTWDLSWEKLEEQSKDLASRDGLWANIEHIIRSADSALTFNSEESQLIKRWYPPSVNLLDGGRNVHENVNIEILQACAFSYCRALWARSPTLELWLVRQLIFAEACAFSREAEVPLNLKNFPFWWMCSKLLVNWAIGLWVAASIGQDQGTAVGVLAYVTWLGLTKFLAKDQQQRLLNLTETFMLMRNSYVLSLRNPACPIEIEKSLSLAEERSAVWPAGLRSIVERGLSRNKEYWM